MTTRRLAAFTITVLLAGMATTAGARGGGHGGGHSSGSHGGSHASGGGSHRISGYTKKNGTHVEPSHAKNPNHTKRDNYTSKGNVNPYTGKEGTKDPSRP